MSGLPPVRNHYPHIDLCDELGGSPVLSGTRVPVRRLWAWHRRGTSVETLVKRYPKLGWARILGALAFAYDNLELIEADLERERALLEAEEHREEPAQAVLAFGDAKGERR